MRRLAVAISVILLVATASAAETDPATNQAAERYQQGLAHAQAGELEAAVVEFRAAYELKPHYSVLFNLGQAYALLGKPVEAIEALERYLADGGASVPERRRDSVETTLSKLRQQVGEVTLELTPPDAALQIDGHELDATSRTAPLKLSPGRHDWTAQADDHQPAHGSVFVNGGERSELRVALEPLPKAIPLSAAPVLSAGLPPNPLHPSAKTLPSEPQEARVRERHWAYGFGSAGVALGAATGVLAYFMVQSHSEWKEQRAALSQPMTYEDFTSKKRALEEHADQLRLLNAWTVGVAIASGALLATGATLFALGSRSESPALSVSASASTGKIEWSTRW